MRYIVEQGVINPTADDNWRLARSKGTTVIFDTGPRASRFVKDVKGIDIEPAGAGANGFVRYRIKL